MKKIVRTLLILILLVLVIDRGFVYLFQSAIFTKTLSGESGGSVNYLLQRKKDVGLIIMGSSRAKHHIDPARLSFQSENIKYNAGINGTGGLLYNARLLHLILEKKIKPGTIILQLDAHPYFTADDNRSLAELTQLYPFLHESRSLRDFVREEAGLAEQIKLFFHSYRYNGKLLNILFNYRKRHTVGDQNGFIPLEGILKDSLVQALVPASPMPAFPEKKLEALRDVLSTCAKENIQLIIVFPPSYHNILHHPTGTNALIAFIKKNGQARVIDFSNIESIPALNQPEYWRDATHLNASGAAIFSDSLHARLAGL